VNYYSLWCRVCKGSMNNCTLLWLGFRSQLFQLLFCRNTSSEFIGWIIIHWISELSWWIMYSSRALCYCTTPCTVNSPFTGQMNNIHRGRWIIIHRLYRAITRAHKVNVPCLKAWADTSGFLWWWIIHLHSPGKIYSIPGEDKFLLQMLGDNCPPRTKCF
jgi:hypothetical protein